MGSRPPNTLGGWIDGGPGPRVRRSKPGPAVRPPAVDRLHGESETALVKAARRHPRDASSCAASAGRRAPHHHTGRACCACPVPGQHLKSSDDPCHATRPRRHSPLPQATAHKNRLYGDGVGKGSSKREAVCCRTHAPTHPAASAEKKTQGNVTYLLGDEKQGTPPASV